MYMMEVAYDRFLLQWCSTVWTAEILQCRVHPDNWLWMNKDLRHNEWMCNMPCKSSCAECNAERTVKPQWLTSNVIQIALQDAPSSFKLKHREMVSIRRLLWPHKYVWLCGFNIEARPSRKIVIMTSGRKQNRTQDWRNITQIIYTTLPMMEQFQAHGFPQRK